MQVVHAIRASAMGLHQKVAANGNQETEWHRLWLVLTLLD